MIRMPPFEYEIAVHETEMSGDTHFVAHLVSLEKRTRTGVEQLAPPIGAAHGATRVQAYAKIDDAFRTWLARQQSQLIGAAKMHEHKPLWRRKWHIWAR